MFLMALQFYQVKMIIVVHIIDWAVGLQSERELAIQCKIIGLQHIGYPYTLDMQRNDLNLER